MRYIALNPARAGMVMHPQDYRWSSYGSNAHRDRNGVALVPHERYLALGNDGTERQHAYRELFRCALATEQLHAICGTTNSCLVLGNDRFREKVARETGRRTSEGRAGGPRKQENSV